VLCSTPSGVGIDSAFALTLVLDGNTVFGSVRSFAAAQVSCYQASPPAGETATTCEAWESSSGATASWISPGVYAVRLPATMFDGNAQVTAIRGGPCRVQFWSGDIVYVGCTDGDGAPTDVAEFDVALVS
jgi:hypothetical protein